MRDDLGSQLRPDGLASLRVSFWQLQLFAGASKRCTTLGQMGKVSALAGHAAQLRDGQPPSCNPHLAACCLSNKGPRCPHARCKYPSSMGTIPDEITPIALSSSKVPTTFLRPSARKHQVALLPDYAAAVCGVIEALHSAWTDVGRA